MFVLLISILIILLDQWTKHWAVANLASGNTISVIGDHLQFHYVENRGAAFGILPNSRLFFLIFTVIVVGALLYYMYKNRKDPVLCTPLAILIGGALGNAIDRWLQGYVVDFISVDIIPFYQFPVFNVADIAVCCGCLLLILLLFLRERKKP